MSQFNKISLAIRHMNCTYFPSTREVGLVDAGAVHAN